MRLRIRAHKGLGRPAAGPRPRPQARPRRHPRDRVLHPDPPAHHRRPRPRPALAPHPATRWRPWPRRAGSSRDAARDARRGLRRAPRRSSTACRCSTTPRPSAARRSDEGFARLAAFCGEPTAGLRRGRCAPGSTGSQALTEPFFVADRSPTARRRPPTAIFADPDAAAALHRRLATAAGAAQRARPRDLRAAASPSCCARLAAAAEPDAALISLDAFLSRPARRRAAVLAVRGAIRRSWTCSSTSAAPRRSSRAISARNAGVLDAVIGRDFYRAAARRRRTARQTSPTCLRRHRRLRDGARHRAHLAEGAALPHRRAPAARPRRRRRGRRAPTPPSPRPCSRALCPSSRPTSPRRHGAAARRRRRRGRHGQARLARDDGRAPTST